MIYRWLDWNFIKSCMMQVNGIFLKICNNMISIDSTMYNTVLPKTLPCRLESLIWIIHTALCCKLCQNTDFSNANFSLHHTNASLHLRHTTRRSKPCFRTRGISRRACKSDLIYHLSVLLLARERKTQTRVRLGVHRYRSYFRVYCTEYIRCNTGQSVEYVLP